jgi:hypothetical protein
MTLSTITGDWEKNGGGGVFFSIEGGFIVFKMTSENPVQSMHSIFALWLLTLFLTHLNLNSMSELELKV